MIRVKEKTRREARISLSLEALTSLFRLPDGAQIESIWPSNRYRDAFEIRVSHETFRPVSEGDYIPELTGIVTLEDDGRLSISWELWDMEAPTEGG